MECSVCQLPLNYALLRNSDNVGDDDNDDDEGCEELMQLGKPVPDLIDQNCPHFYHYKCLYEWSKINNSCPLDRLQFSYIKQIDLGDLRQKDAQRLFHSDDDNQRTDHNHVDDQELLSVLNKNLPSKVLPVPERTHNLGHDDSYNYSEDMSTCQICHTDDDPHQLLICDGCDQMYHLYCLEPPLSSVPMNEWFCSSCTQSVQQQQQQQRSSITDDLAQDLNLNSSDPHRVLSQSSPSNNGRSRGLQNRQRSQAALMRMLRRRLLNDLHDFGSQYRVGNRSAGIVRHRNDLDTSSVMNSNSSYNSSNNEAMNGMHVSIYPSSFDINRVLNKHSINGDNSSHGGKKRQSRQKRSSTGSQSTRLSRQQQQQSKQQLQGPSILKLEDDKSLISNLLLEDYNKVIANQPKSAGKRRRKLSLSLSDDNNYDSPSAAANTDKNIAGDETSLWQQFELARSLQHSGSSSQGTTSSLKSKQRQKIRKQ
ncbi:hypothetical protein MP228_008174 [Amoeboaphelidium protococcarum]|nr:hypothetical protein MP228_008174 [Amoeboaphelidium protococcarum]